MYNRTTTSVHSDTDDANEGEQNSIELDEVGGANLLTRFFLIIVPLAFVACDTVVMNVGGTAKACRNLR